MQLYTQSQRSTRTLKGYEIQDEVIESIIKYGPVSVSTNGSLVWLRYTWTRLRNTNCLQKWLGITVIYECCDVSQEKKWCKDQERDRHHWEIAVAFEDLTFQNANAVNI